MYPFFGDKLLANIHNAAMKEFVNHIADLSPATIRCYVNVAKSVVASARDAEGRMLFPREWTTTLLTPRRSTSRGSRSWTRKAWKRLWGKRKSRTA
jgi:hypothetical protein